LPGDISASARYYHQDLIEPPFVLNPDGTLTVPPRPGIGVTVNEKHLEEVTVNKEVFTDPAKQDETIYKILLKFARDKTARMW
jgi:O-succinylbenzoate synthase